MHHHILVVILIRTRARVVHLILVEFFRAGLVCLPPEPVKIKDSRIPFDNQGVSQKPEKKVGYVTGAKREVMWVHATLSPPPTSETSAALKEAAKRFGRQTSSVGSAQGGVRKEASFLRTGNEGSNAN